MRQTAYLVLDKDGEPRFVETDERSARFTARTLGYSVTETYYDAPDPDTWERIERDATVDPARYCHARGLDRDVDWEDAAEGFETMALDLVARCKKLAGVE